MRRAAVWHEPLDFLGSYPFISARADESSFGTLGSSNDILGYLLWWTVVTFMIDLRPHVDGSIQQVNFIRTASLNKLVFRPPSGPCRDASIRALEERIVSLGACWAFSVQPVLPSVWRPVVRLS